MSTHVPRVLRLRPDQTTHLSYYQSVSHNTKNKYSSQASLVPRDQKHTCDTECHCSELTYGLFRALAFLKQRWQDSNGAYIKEASGYERDNLQQDVSVRSFLTYGFSGREKKNIDQRFIDNLSGPPVLSTPRKLRIRSDTWRRAKANY